ncbi:MAG: hypothetical protein MUO27_02275 [Sedimentisphaerales bacterium]|nr:hypothetical protein [Sedimentisphaerales bacterium]
MNHRKAFLLVRIVCLAVSGFALAGGVPEPNQPNLNNDDIADFYDFAIMANNWQQTGAGLAGDFDDSNAVDIDDLIEFCWYWLRQYSEYQQCQPIDLDRDGIIAFEDMAKLAQYWLLTGEGLAGDFDDSNSVDYNDLSVMADCWLKGSRPETVFERFKAALASADINEAVFYFSDYVADDYRAIFNENVNKLQDLANDMGNLSLEYRDKDIAVYELSNVAGTNFYPVVFTLDDSGQWKIAVF